jgi:serine/threonine-protein kinase
MMGTPAYMAPEQVRGGEIDARADLYAMGVVLYRLLTAKLPFDAETPIAIAHKQLSDPPTPLKLTRPDLPLWCDAVLERALAKSPGDRFQAAEEFKAALAVWAGSGATKRVAPVSGEATTYALPTPISTARQPSGTLSEPKRATANQSLSAPSGPPKTNVEAARVDQTPSSQRTVVIPGKYFFAGTGVLALILIALVAAVFFVLARPLGVPLSPEEASPPEVSGSQAPADPVRASLEPGPLQPADASSPAPTQAQPVPTDGREKAADRVPVAAESSVARTPRTTVSRAAVAGTGARADAPTTDRPPMPAIESGPAESTEGTAGTSETRLAAARALPPMTFEPVKLLVSDGNRSRERDAKLHFAEGQIILIAVGERLIASVAFEDVLALSYSHSRQPRWRNANGTDSRGDFPGGAFGFLKADRRWFAMQTGTHTYVVRVDEDQIGPLMRAASDRTGLPVVRLTDKP